MKRVLAIVVVLGSIWLGGCGASPQGNWSPKSTYATPIENTSDIVRVTPVAIRQGKGGFFAEFAVEGPKRDAGEVADGMLLVKSDNPAQLMRVTDSQGVVAIREQRIATGPPFAFVDNVWPGYLAKEQDGRARYIVVIAVRSRMLSSPRVRVDLLEDGVDKAANMVKHELEGRHRVDIVGADVVVTSAL